jgi:peptidoglycan/xylan/chitin deacetylase (PgdA/CDA1 family)
LKTIYFCYPHGKHKALTVSYDDARTSDRRLVEIFNKYGIRGTFHINGGKFGIDGRIDISETKALYENHEISCHTLNHPTIARCPKELIIQQIMEDRKVLESIAGYPVRGMSYPNGSYDNELVSMLPHLGIEYARIVGDSHNFELPENFLKWKATCHHKNGLINHANDFIALKKTQYMYLFYVWGHSYEFDNDNNWELIEEFSKLTGGKEDIWYATNIEIVDNFNALKQLRFTAAMDIVFNPTAYPVWISVNGNTVEIGPGKTIAI